MDTKTEGFKQQINSLKEKQVIQVEEKEVDIDHVEREEKGLEKKRNVRGKKDRKYLKFFEDKLNQLTKQLGLEE